MQRGWALLMATMLVMVGCEKPQYDTSSPQAALDSMKKMIADGRPEMLAWQASPRGGRVRVTVRGDRVLLGGRAVTVARGVLV